MSAEKLKELIPTEAELCAIFIKEMNEQPGWVCYPETGGFDILVAHESGRQIGVEAKLQLNAKVADQIMPEHHSHSYGRPGPDHRLVIVRSMSDASYGIGRLLSLLGVPVWAPRAREQHRREQNGIGYSYVPYWSVEFDIRQKLFEDERCATPPMHGPHYSSAWLDWNPESRIVLPDAVPNIPAGLPAPQKMTPWKMAAIRVMARLRVQGHVTSKDIASEGCSPTIWTQKWLDRGVARGQWIESERLPALDQQHPELYAVAHAAALKACTKEATLL